MVRITVERSSSAAGVSCVVIILSLTVHHHLGRHASPKKSVRINILSTFHRQPPADLCFLL
jgi:hypothetical protein